MRYCDNYGYMQEVVIVLCCFYEQKLDCWLDDITGILLVVLQFTIMGFKDSDGLFYQDFQQRLDVYRLKFLQRGFYKSWSLNQRFLVGFVNGVFCDFAGFEFQVWFINLVIWGRIFFCILSVERFRDSSFFFW